MGGGGWRTMPDPVQSVVDCCDQVERWAGYVMTSTRIELPSVTVDFNELRLRISALGKSVEGCDNYSRRATLANEGVAG